jgi:hypothetical protein
MKVELMQGRNSEGKKWTKCANRSCQKDLGLGPRWWVCDNVSCKNLRRSVGVLCIRVGVVERVRMGLLLVKRLFEHGRIETSLAGSFALRWATLVSSHVLTEAIGIHVQW